MIKISLRSALLIAFSLAGTISILIIAVMLNFFFDKFFKEYSIKKQEEKNQKVLTLIKSQYHNANKWNIEVVQEIGVSELEEGLIVKLDDENSKTVWDAMQYNSGICERMIHTMTYRMANKYPSLNGGFTTKEYPVVINNSNKGKLIIGYYGPFYYSDDEFFFINTLNRLLVGVTIGVLFFTLLLGYIISKRLSTPLIKVKNTSREIAKGKYNIRMEEKAAIGEIDDLIESINHLAGSLENQERLRKQLTQDISHELRTPMTTLQSHIEAMIDGVWKPSKKRLISLHEEIIRLNSLIKELTVLRQYDFERLKLNKTGFELKKLIDGILDLYEHGFNEKKIKIACNGDELKITADRDKIKQAFVNFISNAAKFTNENGKFKIRIKKERSNVFIEFVNSGKGIPAKDLENIFERLYRVEKSRNRATGGSGIGLSIAKQIIEAHKGSVKAESVRNKETKFTVSLPV
jgi:two-component system, OmpR family, sensor histidine kinase BaeS